MSTKLLARLQSQAGAMRRLLEQLAQAESPSSDPATQAAVFGLLSSELATRGFRARVFAGRKSGGTLLAAPKDRRRGQPIQLLLGHADTVWPRGTLATMPLREEEGKLWGPGVYDMKAGLVQALFAVEAAREVYGEALRVAPVLLVNSDEEIGSHDSTKTIRRLAKAADRCFVLEPSLGPTGKLKTARKGVGRFSVTVRGKAAHAGLDPDAGVSAILELSHVIQKLHALNDAERGVTVNVGTIDGGLGVNVVAPVSRAVVDVRVPSQADAEQIERAIYALRPEIPGASLEISGGIGRPPMEFTAGNEKLWTLARHSAEELGIEVDHAMVGGGSDGNTTSQFAPTLDGLGAVGGGAHASHEHLVLDKMVERAALLARLLLFPPINEVPP
jgi:glutamate carboxypeptidase